MARSSSTSAVNPGPDVFVVEDDDAVRDSLALLLAAHGWHTREFSSAEAFLEAYDSAPGACVISDLQMAGISGAGLVEVLATRGTPLPVAVLTAHPDHPLAARALRAGAVTVMGKPVSEDKLVAVITRMLNGAGSGSDRRRR